jgi:predicted glycogen debranching enzyme
MRSGAEWVEADGLGGFASGPVHGPASRRYHAILLAARTPPANRVVLVNGYEAWIETAAGRWPLTTHRYVADVTAPDATSAMTAFTSEPWPTWRYRVGDGPEVVHELVMLHGAPVTALSWHLNVPHPGVVLVVRPFLTGREFHALHHENSTLRFDALEMDGRVRWRTYEALPAVVALHNGTYGHDPQWYRRVQYDADRARGYDHVEDLASPGALRWDLSAGEAIWLVGADLAEAGVTLAEGTTAETALRSIRTTERRRRLGFATVMERAGDAYVARRGRGSTIIAGYPWFGDWGRDTFIAMRGICLATGRLDEAVRILVEWAGHLSDGMMPNQFPGDGEAPAFNSVDASLWFIIAVHELLRVGSGGPRVLGVRTRAMLVAAIDAILTAYTRGTRHRIKATSDGLLAAGEPGLQLTWMDAKIGDRVLTPRIGKPVEIQALWLNALRIGAAFNARWEPLFDRGWAAFRERFWRPHAGCCYDVIDVDHEPGRVDTSFRPNQLFAVGGLPFTLLDVPEGRRLVDAVEVRLWTPLGPRTLAPDEPGYIGHYEGNQAQRDAAYHQGTVWPWLIGAFVDAWVRVRGGSAEVRHEARERFITPLQTHLDQAMLGHLPEVASGDPPHDPGGCPFQAWSVGELLRVEAMLQGPATGDR